MESAHNKLVAQEFMDGAPDIYVHCGEHMYFPCASGIEKTAITPPEKTSCKHCWEAYYLVFFASLPPHIREQRLEELEFAAHHAAESERRGQLDFKPYRRPEIDIRKG